MSYGLEEQQVYNTLESLEASVWHFRIFWSKCYIKREDKKIGKFDSQVDKGIHVGYSSKRKYYKCYNIRLEKGDLKYQSEYIWGKTNIIQRILRRIRRWKIGSFRSERNEEN